MGKLDGKVAFITGAARGQGRSHAIRLAQEGADIIAIDILEQLETIDYAGATPADMEETVKAVEALDRRIVFRQGDVRNIETVKAVYQEGVAELGPVDIVLANHGIAQLGRDGLQQGGASLVDELLGLGAGVGVSRWQGDHPSTSLACPRSG